MPELGTAPDAEDPPGEPGASAPGADVAAENPRLGRLELELPDGRYLLAYRRLEAVAPGA